MKGALNLKLVAAPRQRGGRKTASKLDSSYIAPLAARGCAGCPLNTAKLVHPKMKPTGAKHPDVYILGEAPGETEDEKGVQFVGPSGQVLRDEIPKEWKSRIRWNNTIRCRPPKNRDPALLEIECCRKQQEEDIAQSKPKLIMGFGKVPMQWMLGAQKKMTITNWRGRMVPVNVAGHKCWYAPMLHPSYIMRLRHQENKGEEIEEVFQRDIYEALDRVDSLPRAEIEDPEAKDEGIILLPCDLKKALAAIKEASKWEEIGFDLETTGLRPYMKDARILSASFSNYERTYALPLLHREATWKAAEVEQLMDALLLMLSKSKPIAHNSKFEQEWLATIGGDEFVHEVDWHDTMAQAYVLDEREGAKGLDSVSRLAIGMNVKALLTRSGRKVNVDKLDEEPLEDVLDYNAYDAKYLPVIFMELAERIKAEKLQDVYRMMNERAGAIALAQKKGVVPDTAMATKLEREYGRKVRACEDAIQRDPDVKKYIKQNGKFLPSSNVDMPGLFHDQLGFKECEVGKKISTDEKVLKQIDHPVAGLVLKLRGADKLRGTYLEPLLPNGKHIWPDGLVHTNYNHLRVSTGRLSSDEPNLQNFPRKVLTIRRVIQAPPKHWMVAFDQGQIEARGIAWASKDKVLTDAIWEKYDVHGEWAQKIASAYPRIIGGKKFLNDKDTMKAFRQEAKNRWVFPLFYGSALKSVAAAMQIPRDTLTPLFDEFWETFDGVRKWQQEMRKLYHKLGYVETQTGRRRHGPLSYNDIINSPIQGVASDIVVDAMVILSRMAYEEDRPQWQWIMNIHDDLTFYLPDATMDDDMEVIAKAMVQPRYEFITTPLVVEVKVGKNWCDLEEVAVFSSTQFGHKRAA